MNINVTSLTNITKIDDRQINIARLVANDPSGQFIFHDIKVGDKMHCFCTNLESGINSYAVYEIMSIEGLTSTKIKNMVLKRINNEANDDNLPTLPAFICSTSNYIDDIPSGDSLNISNVLTETARTYNLQHQPKFYIQQVHVSDIINDYNTTNPQKKHYVRLTYKPVADCQVIMTINGVVWYENEDMIVDRNKGVVYLDTNDNDGFSFGDLMDSTDNIRLQYTYI